MLYGAEWGRVVLSWYFTWTSWGVKIWSPAPGYRCWQTWSHGSWQRPPPNSYPSLAQVAIPTWQCANNEAACKIGTCGFLNSSLSRRRSANQQISRESSFTRARNVSPWTMSTVFQTLILASKCKHGGGERTASRSADLQGSPTMRRWAPKHARHGYSRHYAQFPSPTHTIDFSYLYVTSISAWFAPGFLVTFHNYLATFLTASNMYKNNNWCPKITADYMGYCATRYCSRGMGLCK